MLYDGMDRFMSRAIKAIREGDIETAHVNLHRTGQILLELLGTLREEAGGEIAVNLKKIYVFCYERVVIANLRKDPEMIHEIRQVLKNLGNGWKEIGQKRAGQSMGPGVSGKIRITG
jgi:flagellar protein FliS